MGLATDIRVVDAAVAFEPFAFRTPLELSTGKISDICQATATVRVRDRAGRVAYGRGVIFLGDLWAWPSRQVPSPQRVDAMRALCERLAAGLSAATHEHAHPVVHGVQLMSEYVPRCADAVIAEQSLPEPITHLAEAVCFSPLDAAVHDAFGRLHGIDAYQALDRRYLPVSLDTWLGEMGANRYLGEFFDQNPARKSGAEPGTCVPGSVRGTADVGTAHRAVAQLPGWHVVSKGDALTLGEEHHRLDDGLPNSLEGWIEREGVFCLKIKTTGTDIASDVVRTADVYRAAAGVHRRLHTGRPVVLEVDCNEACPSAEMVVEYLSRLREESPDAYAGLLFVEQPTERDLLHKRMDMRGVAALKPVLIDEGLQSLKSLAVAADLGWSGVAMKTCKTHTLTLLYMAWCRLKDWPFAIVDLTNPGLSAVQAAVLAGRSSPMMGVELNCRQFVPAANAELERHAPGLARMRDGYFDLSAASAIGLGYPDQLDSSDSSRS